MKPIEYLTIRKVYNQIRQESEAASRLTFEELVILCLLHERGTMTATEISDYQQVSRPTMTHRGNRLSDGGLIERTPGTEDRRQVCCSNTPEGEKLVGEICRTMAAELPDSILDPELDSSRVGRMRKLLVSMGSQQLSAGDLALLAFHDLEEPTLISRIVTLTGLLQPTVSMSVSRLVDEGMVDRARTACNSDRRSEFKLTSAGREKLSELVEIVESFKQS